ncbi:Lar family restriction alleviation protein [Pseudomonas sp.]|uniref:Lar family restriction alleviation protein n=1 Tax=Pseudomonas sp. TaxID=306 RepID=UPI002579459B|nr:Lar family restriction alleviation protein [Pseudomonas sp.]
MTPNLLPCPFCGGTPNFEVSSFTEYYGHEMQDWSIECPSCSGSVWATVGKPEHGFDFPCSCCHDLKSAVAAKWNTRALPEGYVLVPCHPTGAMVQAVIDSGMYHTPETAWPILVDEYKAMLAAAQEVE